MKQEYIPLYGTIPFFGNAWNVTFKKIRSGTNFSTSTMSGYGDFPFERFPNIPVIDFTNNDSVLDVLKLNVRIEESTIEDSYTPVIPLKNYLAKIYDMGITIHNYER